jgi:hypothetical protein
MARLKSTEVLDQYKRAAVENQAPVVKRGDFFLAGGTGLALHLGHRRSRDLDWFTPHHFDAEKLTRAIQSLPQPPTGVAAPQQDTVRVFYGELETSFIRYAQVAATPVTAEVQGVKVPVADLETIAAMKAGAVIGRGQARDFVDVHALTRSPGWSMERFVEVAVTRGRIDPAQLHLGMTYFVDAEKGGVGEYCSRGEWEKIKRELTAGVMRAFEKYRGRGRGGPER